MTRDLALDAAERVGVTAALAAASTGLVVVQDWPWWWVPILAAVLNVVKVAAASRVGDPDSGGFATPPAHEE